MQLEEEEGAKTKILLPEGSDEQFLPAISVPVTMLDAPAQPVATVAVPASEPGSAVVNLASVPTPAVGAFLWHRHDVLSAVADQKQVEVDSDGFTPCKRRCSIALLMFLPVALGEIMSGATPLQLVFLNPYVPAFLIFYYGCGIVALRETVVRWNKGPLSIFCFGLSYGLGEEGLTTQSLFNATVNDPSNARIGDLIRWGQLGGINWAWTTSVLLEICLMLTWVSLKVFDLTYPRLRGKSLVSNKAYAFCCFTPCIFMVLGCSLPRKDPPPYYLEVAVAAFLLFFIGLGLVLPGDLSLARFKPNNKTCCGRNFHTFLIVFWALFWKWTLWFFGGPLLKPMKYPAVAIAVLILLYLILVLCANCCIRAETQKEIDIQMWALCLGLMCFEFVLDIVLALMGLFFNYLVTIFFMVLMYRIRPWASSAAVAVADAAAKAGDAPQPQPEAPIAVSVSNPVSTPISNPISADQPQHPDQQQPQIAIEPVLVHPAPEAQLQLQLQAEGSQEQPAEPAG